LSGKSDKERNGYDLTSSPNAIATGRNVWFPHYANNTMIALGEAAAGNQNPLMAKSGIADSVDQSGRLLSLFQPGI
jgi:hypothetical protein